jgi:hypothetical protein
MKPNPLIVRTKRFWKALSDSQKKKIFIGLPLLASAAIYWGTSSDPETRVLVERSGSLDFKGAEILGNPRQSILQGEESQFSKTKKSVLASETELKTQIAALKLEVDELRAKSVVPQLSALPSASPTTEVYGPTSPGNLVVAPNTLSSSSPVTLGAAAPGIEQSGRQDKLRLSQSAPQDRRNSSAADPGAFGLGVKPSKSKLGTNLLSFPVKSTGKVFLNKPGIILPSGSYVKAMLLTGVEAPEGKSYPVLLQLDYAYVIPNDKRLDLAGCFMIAKAQGDLSTERVQMQATKLSCVSKKGGMFEREVNGFIADDADNSFAVVGRVNSKQDRVAATAFLASIVSGIGKAIQQAQTTSQVTPLGGSQTVLTGDQGKFIAAGGASDAAGQVTQWYLKQAQNLLPTINVGSGQGVWVIMQDQVDLPKEYFNQPQEGDSKNASIYSYFTRLID